MIKYKKYTQRVVTPKEAKEMLDKINPNDQRTPRRRHIDHLTRLIRDGLFVGTGHIAIAHMNGKQQERYPNGMHTLNAIVKGNQGVRCFIEEYECESERDYVQLFTSFDTENAIRGMPDCAKAFLMGRSKEFPAGTTPKLLNLFRSGADIAAKYRVGKNGVKETRHERFDTVARTLRKQLEFFLMMDEQRLNDHCTRRAPIIAAMILTYAKDKSANKKSARAFWSQIATGFFDEDQQRPNSPTMRLHNWLTEITSSAANTQWIVSQTHASSGAILHACIRAWNCYVENRAKDVSELVSKGKRPHKGPEVLVPMTPGTAKSKKKK